jgi:ComF family protein
LSNFLGGALDNVRRSALDAARLALPQRCELCAQPSGEQLLCAACKRALPRLGPSCPVCALPAAGGEVCAGCLAHPPPFAATLAPFVSRSPVDRLLHALKNHRRLALAAWAADAILDERERRRFTSRPERLVALPLSPARERDRGYNQAYEIARAVARDLRVPLLRRGVRREDTNPSQAEVPGSARAENLRGVFACDIDLAGINVAVIDDVMATGASLAEFAQTLKRAGAARVENWVVARALPPL